MKLLPRFAAAGVLTLFACCLHQEIALQVDGRFAWLPVFALMAWVGVACFGVKRAIESDGPEPVWQPVKSVVLPTLAFAVIPLAFVLALFHEATAYCLPGGEFAQGSTHAYCEDQTWVPKI